MNKMFPNIRIDILLLLPLVFIAPPGISGASGSRAERETKQAGRSAEPPS